ncbi:MAG TPA: carbohydrate porin, partial [Verrucomicrobiae bacterium]|nr:carbohydrate porin [Verrucomicrobiae bacterium]
MPTKCNLGYIIRNPTIKLRLAATLSGFAVVTAAVADPATNAAPGPAIGPAEPNPPAWWNWHVQNTDIVQGDPGFPAKYSGPNSLNSQGEIRETVTLDLFAGLRLWRGAEAHMDGLMWQGFGLSQTHGIEAFPNGDAYKAGTQDPNGIIARLFIRQTIGLGGEQEAVPDDQLTLAGTQDISRLTFTIGRFSPLDICDYNTYAHDQHTQFLNWAMMGNIAWDYGQDTIGYTTGIAVELNQPKWALRYGFFQMPQDKNGYTGDDRLLKWPYDGSAQYGPFLRSWAMMTEVERRWNINTHPGAIRFLAWLDEAHFASYQAAIPILEANGVGADISAARAYRYKYGFGLNWEQEVAKNIGLFSRLGWNDGHNETWTFTDVNWTASLGVSVNGGMWRRPDDTFGLAGIVSGASADNQKFLEAGGLDITDGDGALTYSPEKVLETYYDTRIWKTLHAALDYQFVVDPAFNQDRGPVS